MFNVECGERAGVQHSTFSIQHSTFRLSVRGTAPAIIHRILATEETTSSHFLVILPRLCVFAAFSRSSSPSLFSPARGNPRRCRSRLRRLPPLRSPLPHPRRPPLPPPP